MVAEPDYETIYGGIDWAQLESKASEALEMQKRYEADNALRMRSMGALQDLVSGKVDITQTPGYQFRLGEGEKALSRRASASRYYMSPRAEKEMTRFGQEYASGEYANEFVRLFKMAYTPSWSPRGGSPAPPTLATMQDKYKGWGGTQQAPSEAPAPAMAPPPDPTKKEEERPSMAALQYAPGGQFVYDPNVNKMFGAGYGTSSYGGGGGATVKQPAPWMNYQNKSYSR